MCWLAIGELSLLQKMLAVPGRWARAARQSVQPVLQIHSRRTKNVLRETCEGARAAATELEGDRRGAVWWWHLSLFTQKLEETRAKVSFWVTLKICLRSSLLNFSLLSFATSNRSHVASYNHSQFASLVSVTSGFPRNSWIFKCDTISSRQRRHKLCLPIIQFGRRQWNWIPPSRNFPNGINIDCATACQRRQTRLNPGKLQTASECFPHGVLVASQPVCVLNRLSHLAKVKSWGCWAGFGMCE